MIDDVRASLAAAFDATLVDELLLAYEEAKTNYYQGGHRLSAVEGGRFCEAAYRMLEQATTGAFTPLGKQLDTEALARTLAALPAAQHADSVRLHLPRALRVVYDIRNKRDTAHLADGIDPNLQDSTLVVGTLDWVLAELVRLHHNVSADEAQAIVDALVTRRAPIVEDFNGFLKVLDPDLSASDRMAVLLYQRGPAGATFDELSDWAKPSMRANLRRTLARLEDNLAYVHFDGDRYFLTRAGITHVDAERLLQP